MTRPLGRVTGDNSDGRSAAYSAAMLLPFVLLILLYEAASAVILPLIVLYKVDAAAILEYIMPILLQFCPFSCDMKPI